MLAYVFAPTVRVVGAPTLGFDALEGMRYRKVPLYRMLLDINSGIECRYIGLEGNWGKIF